MVGTRHIHHFLPGGIIALTAGGVAIGMKGDELDKYLAFPFGVGVALVLDESALLLELDDVYWTEEGVLSVQIVFAAIAMLSALAYLIRMLRTHRGPGLRDRLGAGGQGLGRPADDPRAASPASGCSALEHIAVVVDDYDEAIEFYVGALGFELVEDSPAGHKRWVVVRPPGAETGLLLARADGDEQAGVVGRQFAGRVGLFLRVDDFDVGVHADAGGRRRVRERNARRAVRARRRLPRRAGNRWDLLGRCSGWSIRPSRCAAARPRRAS